MPVSRREVAFLTDPAAGGGQGQAHRGVAVRRLRDSGLVVRDLVGRDAEETLDLARRSVASGVDGLVVCGGDAIFHLGLQAVAGTDVPIGMVPAGTGSDVARYFSLPAADPAAAADRVIGHRTRTVDLARSGHRWFITVMTAGFEAILGGRGDATSRHERRLPRGLATLAELRTLTPIRYHLDLDGAARRVDALLVAVGNGPSFGGGLRIAEGALLDDGLLDVVVIRPMSRTSLVRAYPRLRNGTHVTHPQYEHHRVRRMTVAAPGIVAYADGERLAPLPLTIECVPAALKVWS